jgi:hypothetical protein
MGSRWDGQNWELRFETARLRGILVADGSGKPTLCNHRLRELAHKPSGTRVSTEAARGAMPQFGYSLFRVLARDAYLTELRATPPCVSPVENGVQLVWDPTLRHRAKVCAEFAIREPNALDLDLRVEGYAYYPDYEVLLSMYVAPGFAGGAYVRGRGGAAEQIRVADHPAFHGMYNFFPRDERAAHVLTDGRGQRGRWYWRVAVGRLYAKPMAFSSNGQVDVALLGRGEDVQAVGVTYAGDEARDGVADHRGLYLSLFGRDLHPGEGWRTQTRLVVDDLGADAARHLALHDEFAGAVAGLPRTFEVAP